MAGKKIRREKQDRSLSGRVADTLTAALMKGDDFIVTFETGDEGQRIMHVMTGKLITPCMLGTLSNRCDMPDQRGSRHMILKQR